MKSVFVLYRKRIQIQRLIEIPIVFEDMIFEEGLRLDVMVNDLVDCELKALEHVTGLAGTITQSYETDRKTAWISNQFQCTTD